MHNYKVGYLSGPDDILVKAYEVRAHSAGTAEMLCREERDVYDITYIIKLNGGVIGYDDFLFEQGAQD